MCLIWLIDVRWVGDVVDVTYRGWVGEEHGKGGVGGLMRGVRGCG